MITNEFAKATSGGDEVMLSLSLPGVKAYYYNRKLMKRFDQEVNELILYGVKYI